MFTHESAGEENAMQKPFWQEEIKESIDPLQQGAQALLHTDPKKALMLNALIRSMGIVSYAAQETGIGRRTHYNWLETDAEYKAAVESINDVTLDYTEARLFKHIKENDIRAITFILRTRGRARGYSFYKEREAQRQAAVFNLIVKDKETAEMIMQTKEK